jgi:hypothetical protein
MAAVDAGWSVIGIDNFEAKVNQINSGLKPGRGYIEYTTKVFDQNWSICSYN